MRKGQTMVPPSFQQQSVLCPVLVGRAGLLSSLQECIERLEESRGQVILLVGEAGVGKSRLVAEMRRCAEQHGLLVLQGECFESTRSLPYGPFLDVLQTLLLQWPAPAAARLLEPTAGELSLLLPELSRLAGLTASSSVPTSSPSTTTAEWSLSPELRRRRLFWSFTRTFLHMASLQPLLLVIEDLHWSDETSLELLLYLARRLSDQPFLLLLTCRSEEQQQPLARFLAQLDRERLAIELSLPLLSRDEVGQMLTAILAAQRPLSASVAAPSSSAALLPPGLLDSLFTLSEGNPFLVEELLKSLLMSGRLVPTATGWRYQAPLSLPSVGAWRAERSLIPRSIREAVQQRLPLLSAEARQLLLLAAVAGRRFDLSLLQQVMGLAELQLLTLLKELIRAQLVVEVSAEHIAFRHELIRQAIYADMLVRECQLFHRALAEALERLEPARLEQRLNDLALHCYEAGLWEKALDYARRAGERALALQTPRAALLHFSRALEAAAHLGQPAPARLWHGRGTACALVGDFAQARSDYEQALQLAQAEGDERLVWQCLIDLGLLWSERAYEQAGLFFERARVQAERLGEPLLYAHSLNRLGNWLVNVGQPEAGLQAHRQALTIFEDRQDRPGMAQTRDLLGVASAIAGEPLAAVEHYGQAIALFRALQEYQGLVSSLAIRSTLTSRGLNEAVTIWAWPPAVCEGEAREALELAQRLDWPAGEVLAEHCFGLVLLSYGRFGQAQAHLQRALLLASAIDHQQWQVAARHHLARLFVLMLAPEEALRELETALPLAQKLGSSWWLGHLTVCQSLAYLLLRQFREAEARLSALLPAERPPRTLVERRLAWVAAELALARGRPAEALSRCDELLTASPTPPVSEQGQATALPSPWLLRLRAQALLALDQPEAAAETLASARESACASYELPILWEIYRLQAQVWLRLRSQEQARQSCREAARLIATLARSITEPPLRQRFLQRAAAMLPLSSVLRRWQPSHQGAGPATLTPREWEIALKVAAGKSNREIASELVLSERTVESHVSHILARLGFSSRTQIATWVLQQQPPLSQPS
ncbi:helix-turn-helix transcriptional regulator [Thermogemmatispora onikobensis]|uniref:helix-turn-helix transcriptional regulator n=1 Tax=Thermogemmatispora onikobensis TaxID=732234 RepID=UPI000853DD4F|nr:LuxR family transcriptional regulator [Thermogemmatispora onikobensis]